MKISGLRILTLINILYFLGILLIFNVLAILVFLIYGSKHHDKIFFLGWMFLLAAASFGVKFFNYLKKMIISKARYPLPLNLSGNILRRIKKPYYFGKDCFDLDEIIHDNSLPLTLYYINNHQHPILQSDRDKIIFHNQEYDWKSFTRNPLFILKIPGIKKTKPLIEFSGTHKNGLCIKTK